MFAADHEIQLKAALCKGGDATGGIPITIVQLAVCRIQLQLRGPYQLLNFQAEVVHQDLPKKNVHFK